MTPNCDKCIHRLVCKTQDRLAPLVNSMPFGMGDEKWDFYDKLKDFVADECPEWKEEVEASGS